MAEQSHSPLTHVLDHNTIEIPWWEPSKGLRQTFERTIELRPIAGFQITRFMVMELIVALVMILVLVPVVRHIARNPYSRGWFMNMFEAILLFIRDDVARPSIGGHRADEFLPYLWTAFFFVLFNNLMGMLPGGASATGNINVTFVLAVMTLFVVVRAGMKESGAVGFWISLVPHLDVPWWLKPPMWVLMFFVEIAGLFIRHFVLAMRLFANMFAGHVVLAVILGFILTAWGNWTLGIVMPASIGGVVLLSLLELFVALLQAYVFTFLSAIFIGAAVHPH